MKDLFSNDPVFKGVKRDRLGRFATAEKSMYDKAIRERGWMEFQVEKYRRMAESSNGAFIAQQKNHRETEADNSRPPKRVGRT